MIKKFSKLFLVFTILFLLFSCTNSNENLMASYLLGRGAVSVQLPGASRAAITLSDVRTYDLIISNDTQTQTLTGTPGGVVTFSNLPVGTYTLTGTAYGKSNNRIAYNSITVTVIPDYTILVNFTLYTTLPIGLWNGTSNFYIGDTATTSLTGVKSISSSIADFAFDKNDNLYINNGTSIDVYSAPNYTSSSSITDLAGVYLYNSEDNKMYSLDTTDNTGTLTIYDIESKAVSNTINLGIINYGSYAVSSFVNDVAYLYITVYNIASPGITVTPYKITKSGTTYSSTACTSVSFSLTELGINSVVPEAEGITTMEDKGGYSITDSAVKGTSLYFLVNNSVVNNDSTFYLSQSTGYSNKRLINPSCGALVELTVNGETVNSNRTIGFTKNPFGIEKVTYDINWTTYFQTPTSDNAGFYGPIRILAIKPKKIWIADDGATVENGRAVQKNRVVEVDLETETLSIVSSGLVEFDYKIIEGSYF